MINISSPFIVRPVATSLLMVAFLFAGILGHNFLPISSLPEVDYPTIQVSTFYPGANPSVISSSVTSPLERQFGQMAGLSQMNSSSSNDMSYITLQFTLDTNLDVAEQEVQAAINAASSYLPSELPGPPIYSKVNPADAPIITLALTSELLPLYEVEDYAETKFAQKISQVLGVGLVEITGGQRPAIRIQANPLLLASFGLSLTDIRNSVSAANSNSAKGNFDGQNISYTINTNDQLLTSKEYKSLIIGYKNNSPIYLADVAIILDDIENIKQAAWLNNKQAIIVNIKRQPGANVIKVADNIKALLPQLSNSLPSSINVSILSDRTNIIRASIEDVNFELLLAIILVILVIFIFLHSFSATIIPSIAIPLSLMGSFGFMYLMGFSLNNLSLMALTISTGFVVDDAIVMIENISRYIEKGMKPLEAAFKGSAQIGFTILSLTISLIAVLIPLFFMQDIIGRLFKEFAITLTITIILSAVISLTLTPMMCAYILKPHNLNQKTEFAKFSENILEILTNLYAQSLQIILKNQKLALIASLIIFFSTAILFVIVPKGFFPTQDTGIISGISVMDDKISFSAMAKKQQALAKIILQDQAVNNLSSFIGIDSTNATLNKGSFLITLKDIKKRRVSASEIIARMEPKLKQVSGSHIYLRPVEDISIDNKITDSLYQYTLIAQDGKKLDLWAAKLIDKLNHIPQLKNIASNQRNKGLEVSLEINRDIAGSMGITMQNIDDALYDMFGQRQISTIFTDRNQYHVIIEALPNMQEGIKALDNVYIISPNNNQPIPLKTFTKVTIKSSPTIINRKDQFSEVTISFDLTNKTSLGEAVSLVKKAVKELNFPNEIQGNFQGTSQTFQNSLSNEGWLVLAAALVIYIILGVLYESYIHPITILSTLPSACMGAVLALFFTGKDLNIIALIGIVLLIGIVAKNAIMMVDFALEQQRTNATSAFDAIYNACLLRFRPILMTTMAAMLGAVPLVLGQGLGSELREPLGITIIGGLAVSQVLTLFTTPVIYLYFDQLAAKFAFNRRER